MAPCRERQRSLRAPLSNAQLPRSRSRRAQVLRDRWAAHGTIRPSVGAIQSLHDGSGEEVCASHRSSYPLVWGLRDPRTSRTEVREGVSAASRGLVSDHDL
jgi:hypothetical protein